MNSGRRLLNSLSAISDKLAAVVRVSLRVHVRKARQRFIETCDHCEDTQEATLRRIMMLNAGSEFARDFNLSPETSVEEFRNRIPISNYEFHKPYIDQLRQGNSSAMLGEKNPLLMFALSSGTTSESKYIPITRPFLDDYRSGWRIWGIGAIDGHPGCDGGHILQITSSKSRFLSEGQIPCGNISGLVSSMQYRVIRRIYTLPAAVADIQDPTEKYYTVLRIALADEKITWITTANPGTLVRLSSLMNEHARQLIDDIRNGTLSIELPEEIAKEVAPKLQPPNPERAAELDRLLTEKGELIPKDCWPNLKLLAIWTGGSAGAYLPKIRSLFGEVDIRDQGLHASEGRMTIPLEGHTSEGVLDITSHFFEFIPEEEGDEESPQTLLAHELTPGQKYYILMTTVSGLCRYNIKDVVECTGFQGTTPVLKFLHKGAHISNITGEKVTESQIVDAVRQAASEMEIHVPQFVMVPVWGEPPAYHLLIETDELASRDQLKKLTDRVDRVLGDLNMEYREKRETGRISPVVGQFVADGIMDKLAKSRSQRKGGSLEQYKHPYLIADLEFIDQLPEIEAIGTSKGS